MELKGGEQGEDKGEREGWREKGGERRVGRAGLGLVVI